MVIESVGYAFKMVKEKPFFPVIIGLISLIIGGLGVVFSAIFSGLFFIPAIKNIDAIRVIFSNFFTKVSALKAVKTGMIAGNSEASYVQSGYESIIELSKSLISMMYSFPEVFILIIFGVLIFIFLLSFIISFIYIGWIKVSLDFCDKGKSSVRSFYNKFSVVFKVIASFALKSILLLLPLLLAGFICKMMQFNTFSLLLLFLMFILESYLSLKFYFFKFFIVDQGSGIISSLKNSFFLRGVTLPLFLLFILYYFISFTSSFILSIISNRAIYLVLYFISNVYIAFIWFIAVSYLYKKSIRSIEN